jgi:hypothetical protein
MSAAAHVDIITITYDVHRHLRGVLLTVSGVGVSVMPRANIFTHAYPRSRLGATNSLSWIVFPHRGDEVAAVEEARLLHQLTTIKFAPLSTWMAEKISSMKVAPYGSAEPTSTESLDRNVWPMQRSNTWASATRPS